MNWINKGEIIVYEGNSSDEVILYSPLARKQELLSSEKYKKIMALDDAPEDLHHLGDYIPFDLRPHVESPEDYTLLTVLPNNRCNFSCSYCYSAGCRNSDEMDLNKLKKCIDYFIKSKRNKPGRRNIAVSFMGGGEPMLSWKVVREAVAYSENVAASENVMVSFRIITNGSVLTGEQIEFIRQHNVGISISFEVLEDIQNMQRKHFNLVSENLTKALDAGIDTQLNVTVTPHNVDRIEETYNALRHRYPKVRHAMFEPVTSQDMFPTPEDMASFYEKYTSGFINILVKGKSEGVEITSFPYLRTVFPLKRACPGEFCITAEGNLTGCYCVSTPDHALFKSTCYGNVDADSINIDLDKYNELLSCNVNSKPECKRCAVRWNCGGGCYHQFNTYDKEYCDVVCEFTRRFVYEVIKFRAYHDTKNY